MSFENITTYLPEQQKVVEVANSNRILISRTKFEEILISFSDYNSKSSDFARIVSQDDFLRMFLFLESKVESQSSTIYPSAIRFPLILDPDYDFLKTVEERDDWKKQRDSLKSEFDKTKKELNDLNAGVLGQLFSKFIDDDAVLSALKRERDNERIRSVIEKSFERRKTEFNDIIVDVIELQEKDKHHKALQAVTDTLSRVEYATKNSKTLGTYGILPNNKNQLEDKLSKLAKSKTIGFLMESLCLDCVFKYSFDPFLTASMGLEKITLLNNCPKCDGKGLYHYLVLAIPKGLHKIVLPDTNWLHEVIIGYTLSLFPFINTVFIHKKVSAIIDGDTKAGVQADVICVTKDKKLILVEVTSQSDLNNIMKEYNKKIENLKESRIPYDLFVYVTAATELQKYLGNEKEIVMGINHIPKLESCLSNLLSKQ